VDLSRLLDPKSIAVVGASERAASYGGEALLNLKRIDYGGNVYAVNPGRDEVHGFDCFGSLADLPEAPDAVIVAIPAEHVAAVIEQAGALGRADDRDGPRMKEPSDVHEQLVQDALHAAALE
jgi:acyl-CoA synthetase (NDP forming)